LLGAKDETGTLFSFINVGSFQADIGYTIDQQSRGMMFIVTFIGMLVHWYSMDYMKDDAGKARYFGALSLFMFSMTGIVLANNFAMIFVFWELVGVSSYLLIGHWFEKPSACEAAKKAFLVNRIGDFGFMIGILVLWGASNGEISFNGLRDSLGDGKAQGALHFAPPWLMTLAALGIFMGAVGKSAQVPLHVWLPDAMEGPTPVSALIHAATMVAAGVYMLVRVSFIIHASATAMHVIAGIGGFTALFAALMAVSQNDIKRILAYSTLSQLGYMVMAVGLHSSEAAMFHLYTHAFFKALLFLGAGAVIYACHHEQDIWKMGGLYKYTPATCITFIIGTAALMGFPLTSGFWSKEGILGAAFDPDNGCMWLFASSLLTAVLTSFYMTRCVIVTFFGKPRSDNASHAHEAPAKMILPLGLLAIFALFSGYGFFTEKLQAFTPAENGEHGHWVMIASILALVVGSGGAFLLYRGKDKDPLNIPLFANKFYIDEIYAVIVKVFQDRLAWLVTALDSIFADGLVARLPAAVACRVGKAARSLQSGHLQTYTFALGAGLLLAVYLAVFVVRHAGH
ncbi:MAG: NADH:ubiquinone oxidoreductase subunit, partial [Verrucomicrobiaceae bacterium]|nr:NADH:ubiquinone oxidoreductase subunit [Verrucomicrobiaceae bacterium]